MILTGHKKKLVKEVIQYYVNTTDSKYDDFILTLSRVKNAPLSSLTYSEWLAVKSLDILKKNDVTLKDCIENKDIINASINEASSRKEGEFYTPEIWCVEGRTYLKDMLGDQWGKAYIWDASAGSGNLMRTEGYPQDKLFLSSLLSEDIDILNLAYPDAETFQLDFLNELDYDEYNTYFSDLLPPRLVEVLKNNEPIVFYMNPPYKVMEAKSSDVGNFMASQGMAKSALDIFHQFMYRIVLLKRFYNLTNVSLGIFGPVTMFHSDMIAPLYEEFKKEFKFFDGMCFTAGDFANTSESVGWMVGYTAWRTRTAEDTEDKALLLKAKAVVSDEIRLIGSRLVTSIEENIHNWVFAKDIMRKDILLPKTTMYDKFEGELVKAPSNNLGYLMSSNYVIRATRRCSVTTLPNPDNVPITEENFWRAVGSFTARRCYIMKQNAFDNSQYYSSPETTIEGYDAWLRDALIVFLFDFSAQQASYRNVDKYGKTGEDVTFGEIGHDYANKLFPISQDIVKQVVTDEVIIADMEAHPAQNEFLLSQIETVLPLLSVEAREMFEFGCQTLLTSLHGTLRKDADYPKWTQAWDAGVAQIRDTKTLVPQETYDKYSYLMNRLKDKLYDGIFKYGFMMDSSFIKNREAILANMADNDAELSHESEIGMEV